MTPRYPDIDVSLITALLSGTLEGGYVHTIAPPAPPISRLQQFRNAIHAGIEVRCEEDHRTTRVIHEGFELVYVSKRSWRAARRAIKEAGS